MKKIFLSTAIVISSLTTAQVFAQAKEGQTPGQQTAEVIASIQKELAVSFPQFKETSKYSLHSDNSSYLNQGAHGQIVQEIDAEYLYYSNNSDIVLKAIIKKIKESNSDDFNFDLYQIGFVEQYNKYYIVTYLDYQKTVKLEDLQKSSLEGTGLLSSDLER
jgi:hypothetical protein